MDFSDDAKMLMCGLFFFGKGTVRSHPPHANVRKNQTAFDELIAAGLITKEPFNQFDIWEYRPSEQLAVEAEKHKRWYYERNLPGIPS